MSKERRERYLELLKGWPPTAVCKRHPNAVVPLNEKESESLLTPTYGPCPGCEMDLENLRLHEAGVPSNLLHATLDNWFPDDAQETHILATAKEFAARKRGFLIMLGNVGTGKTHLAVGVMRCVRKPVMFTQSGLLRALRLTYGNSGASDPVEACRNADLCVLDELGVSVGGKDEYPMLHEILAYRHAEFLPTVVTSNLATDELRRTLGDRLTDRLREAAFKVLTFGGQSRRSRLRDQYLAHSPGTHDASTCNAL